MVLPLIAGLVAARFVAVTPGPLLAIALIATLVATYLALRQHRGWTVGISLAAFVTGWASGSLHQHRLAVWDALPSREARLRLDVLRLFASADPRKASGIGRVVGVDGGTRDLIDQRVYFSATLKTAAPRPRRRAVIELMGIVSPLPADRAPDSFDGYLSSSGVNFRLGRARVLAEITAPPAYYLFCAAAAERFRTILGVGIAEKRPALAGLLRAMMLGETRELTEEQHTVFMQSGTMHLFAISGLNIGVIAGALEALLLLVRLPVWLRFLLGTALLWLFVDITGATPSAVRAFAMATFFRAAFVARRPANPLAAIVASAAIVLVLSPLQLFSASFLMSYAIVLTLLLLGVPLGDAWLARWTPWRDLPKATWSWWQRLLHKTWRATCVAIAVGVATTVVSFLTSVEFFRLLTPGSLFANLVLIPTAILVTVGGFAALLCGLVGFSGGAIVCNHAAALALLVIEWLVQQSVRVPGAFIPAHFRFNWIGGLALAAVIAALLHGYATRWERRAGGWWPPFAIVAVVLACGVAYG